MHAFDMLILLEILNSTFYNDNIIYIFQVVSVMGLLVNLIGIVAFRNSEKTTNVLKTLSHKVV
jgi:Co/Zn/Cd efflux system component